MTQNPSQHPSHHPAQAPSPGPAAGEEGALRLLAVDAEDLDVLAAHLQDALVRVGDMAYVPAARRFALVGSRFDWQALEEGCKAERARMGLHFEFVTRVARTGFDQSASETVLNVLHIAFEETDAPAGVVTIHFSGGGALRLEVECLEAHMRDLGERWAAAATPAHPVEDGKE